MTIRGDGVAAYCCAHLLRAAGFRADLETADRPKLPVILLGDQALTLIRDIFEQPNLFATARRIRRRVVAWGRNAAPIELEHSAVIVSEEMLLDATRPHGVSASGRELSWKILATRPLPPPSVEEHFGTRMASATPITMNAGADSSSCWIEALEDGWLFLTPGWLLSVGAQAETLLARSQVVASEIFSCGTSSGTVAAHPRIASPSGAPGWLACGTAAMSFDPICGDGTAHAVREAILASAVIRALADGGCEEDLLAHYQQRLTAGFRRHLLLCRRFYGTGGTDRFWNTELEMTQRGIEWCDAHLSNHAGFRYQLRGLELEAIG